MRDWRKLLVCAAAMSLALVFTGCSKDEDLLVLKGDQVGTVVEEKAWLFGKKVTGVIDFSNAPKEVMAKDKYGSNYYSGAGDAQVKTGYLAKVGHDVYVQFPVNYIAQEWMPEQPGAFEYWNGGTAISNFTDMTQGDFQNQMSVYNAQGGHRDANFGVCFGYSDFFNDAAKTYSKCTKIYLTDSLGYRIGNDGFTGKRRTGSFNSVWVCNTTYAHLVMRDGNSFTNGSLKSHNGWFKVVFRALDKKGNPITNRKVEYYLANFDKSKERLSNLKDSIRMGWNKVDLTPLGRNVSVLIVDFEGSDSGSYGLNTPGYVAIDDLSVTVNVD